MKKPVLNSLRYRERTIVEMGGHAEPAFPAGKPQFLTRNRCGILFSVNVVLEMNHAGNPCLLGISINLALKFLECHEKILPSIF